MRDPTLNLSTLTTLAASHLRSSAAARVGATRAAAALVACEPSASIKSSSRLSLQRPTKCSVSSVFQSSSYRLRAS